MTSPQQVAADLAGALDFRRDATRGVESLYAELAPMEFHANPTASAAGAARYVTSGTASEAALVTMMTARALPARAKAWLVDRLSDPDLVTTLITTQALSSTQVEGLIARVGDALTGDQWRTLWSLRRDLGLGSSPLLARIYPHLDVRDQLEAIAISAVPGLIGRDEHDEVERLVTAWLAERTPGSATYVSLLQRHQPFLRTLAYFIEHRPDLLDALLVARDQDTDEPYWSRRHQAVVASVVSSRHWTGLDTQRAWLAGAGLPDDLVLAVATNPVTRPEIIAAMTQSAAGRRSVSLSGALERATQWRSRWPADLDYARVAAESAGAILDYLAAAWSVDYTSIHTPWRLALARAFAALGTNESLRGDGEAARDARLRLAAQSRRVRRRISHDVRLVDWSRRSVDPSGAGDESAQRRIPRRHELAETTGINCPARGRGRPSGRFYRSEIDEFAERLGDSIEAHRIVHSLLPIWTGSLVELADVAREMGDVAVEATAA